MRLSRFYINSKLTLNSSVDLAPTTSHYVKNVLRLKNGQDIILFNGQESIDYTARIEMSGKQVRATPISLSEKKTESPLQTSLFQAIGKPDHMDLLIQKATELGISQLHLFNSQRTQTHLKGDRLEKKMTHWQGIIISACEQCGRNILPTLNFKPDLQTCLQEATMSNKVLLDFDGASIQDLTTELDPELMFTLLIGAEGGLSTDEIQLAKNHGFKAAILGPRILRMETAAMSVISIIQHHFGDM